MGNVGNTAWPFGGDHVSTMEWVRTDGRRRDVIVVAAFLTLAFAGVVSSLSATDRRAASGIDDDDALTETVVVEWLDRARDGMLIARRDQAPGSADEAEPDTGAVVVPRTGIAKPAGTPGTTPRDDGASPNGPRDRTERGTGGATPRAPRDGGGMVPPGGSGEPSPGPSTSPGGVNVAVGVGGVADVEVGVGSGGSPSVSVGADVDTSEATGGAVPVDAGVAATVAPGSVGGGTQVEAGGGNDAPVGASGSGGHILGVGVSVGVGLGARR